MPTGVAVRGVQAGKRRTGRARGHVAAIYIALLSYFPAIVSRYKIYYITVFLISCWMWMLTSRSLMPHGGLIRKGLGADSIWLVIFYLYLTTSAIWALYPSFTLKSMAVNSIFLLVWFLAYVLATNYSAIVVANTFKALTLLILGIFLYLIIRFGTIRPYDQETMKSFGLTGNAAGLWLAISLPFLLWLVLKKARFAKSCVVLAVALVFISQSRAAYLIMLFCFLMYSMVTARRKLQYVWRLMVAAAALLGIVSVTYALPFTRNIVETGIERLLVNDEPINRGADPGSLAAEVDVERLWMFEQGWEGFSTHPIRGVGYNNITVMTEDAYGYSVTSHNILLTLIAECGIPGLLIFATLMASFFRRICRNRRKGSTDREFWLAMTVAMVAALLSGMMHPLLGLPLFYMLLGFGYGLGGYTSKIPNHLLPVHQNLLSRA